eukprot:gb/GECH01005233.1/.p1 GENE.gb/GECH01005233.1/~~gb/GECH01005233.1/.p1  ORF type:complete len:156 (+),score=41.02 gb/GECH01005233.1/:1-468(+)
MEQKLHSAKIPSPLTLLSLDPDPPSTYQQLSPPSAAPSFLFIARHVFQKLKNKGKNDQFILETENPYAFINLSPALSIATPLFYTGEDSSLKKNHIKKRQGKNLFSSDSISQRLKGIHDALLASLQAGDTKRATRIALRIFENFRNNNNKNNKKK